MIRTHPDWERPTTPTHPALGSDHSKPDTRLKKPALHEPTEVKSTTLISCILLEALHLSRLPLLGALAFAWGGITTALAYIALAAYAQSQLLLSDYVQHYGLTRKTTGAKPEPVGPSHSWPQLEQPALVFIRLDAERAETFRPPRASQPSLSRAINPGRCPHAATRITHNGDLGAVP